jgi:hypothetical protein
VSSSSGAGAVGTVRTDYLAADVTNSTTTPATTGLGWNVFSTQTWMFEASLVVAGTLNGMKFQLNGLSTATGVLLRAVGNTTSPSTFEYGQATAFNANVAPAANGWCAGNVTGSVVLKGLFSTGASGGPTRVDLQFLANTAAQTQTVKAGCFLSATRLA